jgi:16S rRNA (guanine527-N7)-methyltransferase
MNYATESNTAMRKRQTEPLSPEAFQRETEVSDAGLARFRTYLAELERWQKRINLVGPATLKDPWRRHFLDSAQLALLMPPDAATLIDVGSGAGFPGLVLALMQLERPASAQCRVTLVESDQRKAVFLLEIIRLTGAPAALHEGRAEAYAGEKADVLTARACAPLTRLLALTQPLGKAGATYLFPKGADAADELTAAGKDWKMQVRQHRSATDPDGAILEIIDLARRDDA